MFKPGEFRQYRVLLDINCEIDGKPTVLGRDQEVEFDGVTLKLGSKKYPMTKLKGAIVKGWLAPVGVEVNYRPQPAGVQMRTARSTGDGDRKEVQRDIVSQDEIVVGEARAPSPVAGDRPGHKKLPSGQVVPGWLDESLLPAWPDRRDFQDETTYRAEVERYVSAVINQLARLDGPPKSMRADQIQQRSQEETGPKRFQVHAMDSNEGEVIGRIKTSPGTAVSGVPGSPKLKQSTGDKTPDALRGPAGGIIREGVRSLEAKVNSLSVDWGTPKVQVGSAAQVPVIDDGVSPVEGSSVIIPSREDSIAEVVNSWDKERHWRARVAEAVEFYADSPGVIEAIAKIETPGVAKRIREAAGLMD